MPKTQLNVWVMPNAGFATRAVLQIYANEFEKRLPNVDIHLTVLPWSLAWNRLMDMIKGRYLGSRPDVIQVGTTWVATLAYLGALEKVPSGVLPESDQTAAYIWDPGSLSDAEHDLFCIPWFIDIRALYYRKDIFAALGIDPQLLGDWKGFHTACYELQKAIRKGLCPDPRILAPLAIPGQKPAVLMHDLAPWIWAAGGDFCSAELSEAILNTPASIRGCEYYFDLINDSFMPIPDTALPGGNFFSGNYAMQFSGSWPAETFLNPTSEYYVRDVAEGFGVTLYPAGPKGRFTFLGGSNLAVTAGSRQKEEAWELVRFLAEPARQLSNARAIGAMTARLASLDSLFERYPEAKKVFWDSFSHARRLPRLVELGSVEQIIYKMSSHILSVIARGQYNHRRLMEEIVSANNGISAVLSLHRYGARLLEKAS